MFQELDPTQYDRVRSVFQPLSHHLAVLSVIAGDTNGVIYVVHAEQPRAALCQCKHRFYLAGRPDDAAFVEGMKVLFTSVISQAYPAFNLFHDEGEGWRGTLDQIFDGLFPLHWRRNSYTLTSPEQIQPHAVPDGMVVRRIDAALMAETALGGYDELAEELQSERVSVEDFLARSFGFCAVAGSEIAGMCTSEFNTGTRTELGINTMQQYQRRGVASALVSAFAHEAFNRGYREIGWHCWESNQPSVATALTCGFQYVSSYPTVLAYFNPVTNLAIRGDVCVREENYAEAVEWFERAFALGDGEAWAYYVGAQAYAALGQDERALDYLEKTVSLNPQQASNMAEDKHFERLHGSARWQALQR